MTNEELEHLVARASKYVGALWPLDRAIAVNPLLDCLDVEFDVAVTEFGRQLGRSLWPTSVHLNEATRRGLGPAVAVGADEPASERPGTLLERVCGHASARAQRARDLVGQLLLEAASTHESRASDFLSRVDEVLGDRSSWIRTSADERRRIRTILNGNGLEDLLTELGWDPDELVTELSAHFARSPGWAAWAKWCDTWRRHPHAAALSRQEFLAVSLAVDLAFLEEGVLTDGPRPVAPVGNASPEGHRRLVALEAMVHERILRAVTATSATPAQPRFQVVMCIDVRSEPLRRALEQHPEVETLGFAGFFGIPASITLAGEREPYDALPVLVAPSVTVAGGVPRRDFADGATALSGTFAELTHEPGAMFALAEATGWLGAPTMVVRTAAARRHSSGSFDAGTLVLDATDRVSLAEGALRTMGLTANFAPEVAFVGHVSQSRANTHYAALDCGACAGHGGGPNAQVLADLLNDDEVRTTLAQRGIAIPTSTRFVAGEHHTTTEEVTLFAGASDELRHLFESATASVATTRAERRTTRRARRVLRRRAADWGEVRPEWGLAGNAAFVVAPRQSSRSADLFGQCFLHSYDPVADDDGAILTSILTAPVVVAQWINAAYYFSTVAPDVLGAGDKTVLNPVGDFAVIAGDDPDLRMGLPWQSVALGDRPYHLPVRLLVAVEAPLARTAAVVAREMIVRQLVDGGWIRLFGREDADAPWCEWVPHRGWDQP